ncbi:hypothetical protein BKA62DRAFT_702774 [Auriculariales sp. MPI-PUGE-AT-0066]|nr:hypothetical protein BKA62DRAFT_702774 [Auriculariales sp. MPI-PUGE-AT-0066]
MARLHSPIFHENNLLQNGTQPDTALISIDHVDFFVHAACLLADSANGFGGLLPAEAPPNPITNTLTVVVPESSRVLNAMLHAAYSLTIPSDHTDIETLVTTATSLLDIYGFTVALVLSPPSPLHAALTEKAADEPLKVYTLAGHYGAETLAIVASSNLISFPLALLTDADAEYIGGPYVLRLALLQHKRATTLKRMLQRPIDGHEETSTCGKTEQLVVIEAWSHAAALLTYIAAADTAGAIIEAAFSKLQDDFSCLECCAMLVARIATFVHDWAAVQNTI